MTSKKGSWDTSMVSEAKARKVTSCIVPRENEKEAELVEGIRIIAVGKSQGMY